MEMEFYVNTEMHVYVYVCVRDDFWISCFIVLVQLPRSLHAGFLLCHYSPAPHVQ